MQFTSESVAEGHCGEAQPAVKSVFNPGFPFTAPTINPHTMLKSMKLYKYALLLGFVLVSFYGNAQRYAVNPGSWNSTNTWSTSPGGSSGASIPTSSDDVYTENISISIPTGTAAECNSLYVAYNVANGITFGLGSPVLNIYGELAAYDPSTSDYAIPTAAIIKNNANNLEINLIGSTFGEAINQLGWGPNAPLRRVSFNPGTGNTVAIHDLVISSGGTLTVKNGTLDVLGNLQSAAASGTITVNSGSTLLVSAGSISGLGGNSTNFPTINNNGTITSTANSTSFINASTVNLNANSIFNVGYNGSDQTQGWWYQSTSPSSVVADVTSTVNYNASAAQNVFAQGYGNLTFGGSGTITKTVSGTGSLNLAGDLTFNNTGITLTSAKIFVFNGTGAQQISGGGTANFNGGVTINKTSGTLTIAQDINWQGVLNLNQGTLACTNNSTITATGVASITGNVVPSFFSLAVSGAGNLTSSSGNVNIGGNFINNGTFNANNGTLTFNGAAGQTISGTTNTTFSNITSTNGLSVTVATAQSISDALTISAGVFNSNGNVTLLSSSTRDARIAQVTGGATIGGSMKIQRYLPNTNGSRAYRYIASPLTNALVSDWKSEFPITGTFNDPSTVTEWPAYSNLVSSSPSFFFYNEAHAGSTTVNDRYESFPLNGTASTSTTLVNGKGYAAYVRQTAPITLDLTGSPNVGTTGVSVTAQSGGGNDGWNLIGNPYASPIGWQNVTIPSGVNSQIAIQDNTNVFGTGAGTYAYYTQGGVGVPATYTGTIASGQAFFVRATATAATIFFQEDDKVTTANPNFIREGVLPDLLRINLTGNNKMDELVIHFKKDASDNADTQFDAWKLPNPSLNFSSLSADGKKMAINTLSGLSCNKEVSLVVEGATTGSYLLNFSDFENITEGIQVKLVDNFTGETRTISTDATTYAFDVTADANTFGANRFKVKFVYPTVLPDLNVFASDVCSNVDSKAMVSNSQKGVSYYATVNGIAISSVVMGNGGELEMVLPNDKLSTGDNEVVIMASAGSCGDGIFALTHHASVKKDALYSITSALGKVQCQQGAVTLTAAGATSTGSYRWYESSDATTSITGQTAAVFTTPVLNKSKTYYVSIVNSLGCEGARKEVEAHVTNYDDATITQLDNLTLQSNHELGNQWYLNEKVINGATGKTLEIKESGIYKLNVTVEGSCETSAEREMIVTGLETELAGMQIYPNPVKDILTMKLSASNGAASGVVKNELGQTVGQFNFKLSDNFLIGEFNFEERMPGLYIVRITQGNSVSNHKIVKK